MIERPMTSANTRLTPTYNRHLAVQTGSHLLSLFKTYYDTTLEDSVPPTIPGFVTAIGTTQPTFRKLCEVYPNECDFIKDCIESSILNGALTNSFNPTFSQFLLKNRFQYSAADIEMHSTAILTPKDRDALIEQIRNSREKISG